MHRLLKIVLLLTQSISFIPLSSSAGSEPSTFRAAVYEHIPSLLQDPKQNTSRKIGLELMKRNLEIYKTQTEKAQQQGAQIIVFPEDGLYGMVFTRHSIQPFLEKIPDPKQIHWSPCSDPKRFHNSEVQHALSCMAKENSLYVVANMGDWVPCDAKKDPKCPTDGHYQYNTDVAFDPDGYLVAKYHKTHLFYEDQFDTPEAEVVYFDTPFGRFGMLVCFDLLFKDPAVTMVIEKHGITNIVFPTAWMDALPLLSAIGYHSSFARGLGVNFLSANIHLPAFRFHGSGIYTPDGMSSFYYNNEVLSPGKLLVSTLKVIKPNIKDYKSEGLSNKTIFNDFNSTGDEFQAELFDDLFTFRLLDGLSGSFSVCQKNVCCSLSYERLDDVRSHQELFAFGAFDGLHTKEGQYYFQICTVVKCADDNNRESCGSPTKVSHTKFKSLTLTGNFQTKFVYPQVVMDKDGQLLLGDQESWSFEDTTLAAVGDDLGEPLLTAALFGRYYCRDDGVSQCDSLDHSLNHSSKIVISFGTMLLMTVATTTLILCS